MTSSGKDQRQVKILVCGAVCGNFSALQKKLTQLNDKSGPFDCCIAVGDFFGPNEVANQSLLANKFKFPIPLYVLGPSKAEHLKYYSTGSSADLAENVYFLGFKGLFTTADGVSIAYLSGVQASENQLSKAVWEFDAETCKDLVVPIAASGDFVGVDILLTAQCPKDIDRYDNNANHADLLQNAANFSSIISKVASILKPRYHFASGSNCYFERQPYRNHRVLAEPSRQVTRFLALGDFANPAKAKFLYAFSLTPLTKLAGTKLYEQPPDTTEFPFANVLKLLAEAERERTRRQPASGQNQSQFFFDMSVGAMDDAKRFGGRRVGQRNQGRRPFDGGEADNRGPKKPRADLPPAACWFCLASPEVEKHLIVSIGDHSYMALPKGPLLDDHVLILPIGHIQSMISAPGDVREEVERYKSALQKMFAEQKKSIVFYERNFKSQHLQIQAVALPTKEFSSDTIKEAFMNAADAAEIQLTEIPKNTDLSQIVNANVPYFYVELPSQAKLFCQVNARNFPLQFAREVLSSRAVLNCPDRADWRKCALDRKEETELAAKFKADFGPFDFSLSEEDN